MIIFNHIFIQELMVEKLLKDVSFYFQSITQYTKKYSLPFLSYFKKLSNILILSKNIQTFSAFFFT